MIDPSTTHFTPWSRKQSALLKIDNKIKPSCENHLATGRRERRQDRGGREEGGVKGLDDICHYFLRN